jgi:hypothetical protein
MSLVTAQKLAIAGVRQTQLNSIVREHINAIDIGLQKHERRWGRNVYEHVLPHTFTILIDKRDAQRFIYWMIMTDLEKRGFEVCLMFEGGDGAAPPHDGAPAPNGARVAIPERNVLYIAWNAEINQDELVAMNKYIAAHMVKSGDELNKFMTKSTAAKRPAAAGRAGAPNAVERELMGLTVDEGNE